MPLACIVLARPRRCTRAARPGRTAPLKLRGKLASAVPGGGVKVLTHANVVVYGATGSDHTGAVTTAVQSLG